MDVRLHSHLMEITKTWLYVFATYIKASRFWGNWESEILKILKSNYPHCKKHEHASYKCIINEQWIKKRKKVLIKNKICQLYSTILLLFGTSFTIVFVCGAC